MERGRYSSSSLWFDHFHLLAVIESCTISEFPANSREMSLELDKMGFHTHTMELGPFACLHRVCLVHLVPSIRRRSIIRKARDHPFSGRAVQTEIKKLFFLACFIILLVIFCFLACDTFVVPAE